MSVGIKRRRGTTAEHELFTGLEAELTVDLTKKTVVVHDGATAGGNPLATEANLAAGVSEAKTYTDDSLVPVTTQLDAILSQTDPTKKYKFVACVLQNDGAGNWAQIGGAHKSLNVESVTVSNGTIVVTYNFTATNVVSFVACPDETFSAAGYNFGASVGLNAATIVGFRAPKTIGGYVSYNGSAWDKSAPDTGIGTITFSGGIITIPHYSIPGALIASASCRTGKYTAHIGTCTDASTTIYIRDYAGNLVTTPDTDMQVYFQRSAPSAAFNASVNLAAANIWCFGIFEVE